MLILRVLLNSLFTSLFSFSFHITPPRRGFGCKLSEAKSFVHSSFLLLCPYIFCVEFYPFLFFLGFRFCKILYCIVSKSIFVSSYSPTFFSPYGVSPYGVSLEIKREFKHWLQKHRRLIPHWASFMNWQFFFIVYPVHSDCLITLISKILGTEGDSHRLFLRLFLQSLEHLMAYESCPFAN